MTQLKELYKGKCLDDLEKYYQIPELKKNKLSLLLNTARKMYNQADLSYLDGDEELAYIYFMKYFNLLNIIRKMPDYSKQKEYVHQMLGSNSRHSVAMDKAESLCKSLRKRYAELQENEQYLKNQNANVTKAMEHSSSSSDDEQKNTPMLTLTCKDLFQMTQNPSTSLLVMDCRPKNDFTNSRMNYQFCLSVPEEIILPGMSAGKIQQQLEPSSRALWASRAIKDHVVLMDWNCRGPEPILHTPIWRLRDILQNWDPDVTYRSPIKTIPGGYEQFVLMYPTQCSNPNVKPPNVSNQDTEMFDDIEYPSINDITMKEDVIYGVAETKEATTVLRPNVDRSSKASAIQTYDEKQRMLDILKQRDRLTEKYLLNERSLLEAENDWQCVTTQEDKTVADEQKHMLISRKQELLFKILQLENNERDYKLENERLREELEEYKKREKEFGQVMPEKETVNLEERIETKLQEGKQIDEQREKYTQEREKQLAIAREQKRHLKPPTDEDEISKPKMPQFDRSVKPIPKVVYEPPKVEKQRDFSPLRGSPGRGLTGLKNLGNTCYMNSIMQCISNTTALAEYFITSTYKKQINLSNKTKGKIADEVAALIKILWSGHYKCVASKDLRYIIGQYQQIFRGIEQQDSHEFLTILMDWLHSDLQTLQIDGPPRGNLRPAEKAWMSFTESRESYILRLFYGQIKSTVKCIECEKESATYECFSNLSLELPEEANRCSLKDCLQLYFGGEKIKGWNCPSCKQKRDAIKKLDISKLPPILVIHFKRFYADTESIGNTYKKKQNYVIFPLEKLDMVPYIARSESKTITPKTYHLYGVSNHYGSMESGHYTAFCKSSVYKKWFKFDDQIVSSLDQSDVVSSAAYILFYTYLPGISPPPAPDII